MDRNYFAESVAQPSLRNLGVTYGGGRGIFTYSKFTYSSFTYSNFIYSKFIYSSLTYAVNTCNYTYCVLTAFTISPTAF